MKEFSKFQVATLKRVAQSVSPLVRAKEKLVNQITECEQELKSIQIQIDAFQGPIKEMTGGYTTEDLVVREVSVTDKLDKEGKPVKVTKWVLRYPDTVVPVEQEEQEVPEEAESVVGNIPPVVPNEEPQESSDSNFDFNIPEQNI